MKSFDTFLSKNTTEQVHKDIRPIASDMLEFPLEQQPAARGPRVVDTGEDVLGRPYSDTDPVEPGDDGYDLSGVVYGPASKSQIEKIGWTDEARAAAALARQKGYSQMGRKGKYGVNMQNINGHTLQIQPSGQWSHRTPVDPTGGVDSAHTMGHGTDALHGHLSNMHGLGTGPTSRDLAERDRNSVAAGKNKAVEAAKKHGFSHWGIAHPNAGGPQDVYTRHDPETKTGHSLYIDQQTGEWSHENQTSGVGPGIGRVAGQGKGHELDAHLEKHPKDRSPFANPNSPQSRRAAAASRAAYKPRPGARF